jgi:hypothetical protein
VSIDYSAAGEWAHHVRALAMVESNEDETAIGDGGRAFGLLQMHPGRFLDESHTTKQFRVTPGDTWTLAQIKAAASYFEVMRPVAIELTVIAWNLGRAAVFLDGERNEPYFAKWKEHYEALSGHILRA